jgi:murein DD-endopeptidase MepM/ murein hydrolase activator NlpD
MTPRFWFAPLRLLPLLVATVTLHAKLPEPTRQPLHRSVDLTLGETAEVTLSDGSTTMLRLLDLEERVDTMSGAVRAAKVQVEVNGATGWIDSANYHLPVSLGGVQIDCPVTRGYNANSGQDAWGLKKDARLRLWPEGSPWMEPDLFRLPARQRWLASSTQFSNEPTYVDGGDRPDRKKIYYHNDLDFGGCEALVEVVAATDGLVVSVGESVLPGTIGTPVRPRYDVVYLLDERGWFYRYSHLHTIDGAVKPGTRLRQGQKLGLLGKEGASGGWSHLHFGIQSRQPSGEWGTEEAYAFAWQAALREQQPAVVAVARPHHFVRVGEPLVLDGAKSWAAAGVATHAWTFTDGTTATGARVERRYDRPGQYSEILKVTDATGHAGYDFAVVQVIGDTDPTQIPPAIHATYAPSLGVRVGDELTFKVRVFRSTGGETWDFGDGTAPVQTRSDGSAKALARDGYAVTSHRFAKPGDHLVRVEHVNARGEKAMTHLWVPVAP